MNKWVGEWTKESTQFTDELLLASKLHTVNARQMFLPGVYKVKGYGRL